jgi:hypothetical protein
VVSVLTKSLVVPHPYSGEVMSVAWAIVGRLIVDHEEPRQGWP